MKTLSKKNPYYISKYRKLELMYFCRQYPEWKEQLKTMTSDVTSSIITVNKDKHLLNLIEKTIEKREYYVKCIERVEKAARMLRDNRGEPLCESLMGDILYAAIYGVKYSRLTAKHRVCCGERQFYEYLRQFYYILDS